MRFSKALLATATIIGIPLVIGAAPSGADTACSAPVVTGTTSVVTCSYDGTTGADGSPQTWTVPAGVTSATFDVYGAQGGSISATGGDGGKTDGTVATVATQVFTIIVAGQGLTPTGQTGGAGGYGGGGAGGIGASPYFGSAGGGGASSVSTATATILIAGGGGGAANASSAGSATGGLGGGLSGTQGLEANFSAPFTNGGAPGTQTGPGLGTNGTSGVGSDGGPGASAGDACLIDGIGGGGGGGGYYGGAGGGFCADGGGGGSGYIDASAVTSSSTQAGGSTGNGLVTITYEVSLPTPQITTQVEDVNQSGESLGPWTGNEVTGVDVGDSAVVTGVGDVTPTGQVTSTLYNNATCAGGGGASYSQDLSAGATPVDPGGFLSFAPGSYSFLTTYSGDTNYATVSTCEPFSVNEASTIISTAVVDVATGDAWTGTESPGASAEDAAVLSPDSNAFPDRLPTGTVTYSLWDNATCSSTPISSQAVVVDVTNNYYSGPASTISVPTSNAVTDLSAGSYSYQAVYSGDLQFFGVTSACEPFSVGQATPTITTTPSVTNVTLGSTTPPNLTDTATLSGGDSPTGTLTFSLVYNGATVHTETVSVNGSGSYSTLSGYTLPTTGTVVGTYQWNATYSGDTNNAAVSETNNVGERVVVKGRPESTSTSMNIAKGTLSYGAEASQTINGVVTGQKNDGAPEGSVNVTYGPSATPLCSAVLVPGTGDTSTYKCALSSNTQLAAANYLTVRATFVPAAVSSTSANFVYTTSMSGPFSGDNFLVKKDSTTTKVTVSPNSVTSGSESLAIFSVSVKTGNGEVVPNGETVAVKSGSATCVVTLSDGQGSCFITNSALGAGSYSVSATYAGDTNLTGSSGSGPQLTVKKH